MALQSKIEVKRVASVKWDEFLPRLEGSTFFDTARWQDSFKYKVDEIHYIHFLYKGKVVAGCACGVTREIKKFMFKTPFTAPFGGILSVFGLSFSLWVECVRALQTYCLHVSDGERCEVNYTRRSRTILGQIQEAEDFALIYNGFSLDVMFCDFFLDLASPLQLSRKRASKLRKIEREERFQFGPASADEFVDFRDRIVKQQQKRITVPTAEILSGSDLFLENILFYKATFKGETVAVLLADYLHGECCIGRNWYSDRRVNDVALFLVWKWLQLLITKNVRYAGMGSSATTAKLLNESVIFFKERFSPMIHDSKKKYVAKFEKVDN